MSYRDYIHCANCDCKLIYDGYDNIRENLEDEYGEGWELLCPGCLKKLHVVVRAIDERDPEKSYSWRYGRDSLVDMARRAREGK